jgi:hypothetical protein
MQLADDADHRLYPGGSLSIGKRAPRMSGQHGLHQPPLAGSRAASVYSCDRTTSTISGGTFDGEPVSNVWGAGSLLGL